MTNKQIDARLNRTITVRFPSRPWEPNLTIHILSRRPRRACVDCRDGVVVELHDAELVSEVGENGKVYPAQ